MGFEKLLWVILDSAFLWFAFIFRMMRWARKLSRNNINSKCQVAFQINISITRLSPAVSLKHKRSKIRIVRPGVVTCMNIRSVVGFLFSTLTSALQCKLLSIFHSWQEKRKMLRSVLSYSTHLINGEPASSCLNNKFTLRGNEKLPSYYTWDWLL